MFNWAIFSKHAIQQLYKQLELTYDGEPSEKGKKGRVEAQLSAQQDQQAGQVTYNKQVKYFTLSFLLSRTSKQVSFPITSMLHVIYLTLSYLLSNTSRQVTYNMQVNYVKTDVTLNKGLLIILEKISILEMISYFLLSGKRFPHKKKW